MSLTPISRHRLLDLAELTLAAALSPSALTDNIASFRIRPLNWAPISINNVFRFDKDMQVVAFNYGNDLVVTFHSSTTPDQIDLRRERFAEAGGAAKAPKVAAGVLRQWRLLALPVSRCIDSWLRAHTVGNVYVTGHGVGAGLATLQAMFLNCPDRIVHVTFGAMRAFSSKFRTEFRARVGTSVRVVNGVDDVPTMAIWNGTWPSRLHQVGDVMWFIDGKSRRSRHDQIPRRHPDMGRTAAIQIINPLNSHTFRLLLV